MNNNMASVAGVAANNRAQERGLILHFLEQRSFFFFYFIPTHLKHTTFAFLMHTHTASLSRLFLMRFLFPLSPVNLFFSVDYMEILSNFQLNRPLVSAQDSQILFTPPSLKNKNSTFGTSAVFTLG